MAGSIDKGHKSYSDFNDGYNSRQAPIKTHGQILRNFGMYPPEFWTKAQRLADHPEIDPQMKDQLSKVFPDPSRPGPMGGGAPIKTDGKNFSHGLEW